MGTHPIFESDFDCLTEKFRKVRSQKKRNAIGGIRKEKAGDVHIWR